MPVTLHSWEPTLLASHTPYDSFPFRAASFLVVICAGRGFISFGLSYATLPAIATLGYDGTMSVEEVICIVLALFAIPMFFFGSRIRDYVQRWCDDKKTR